MRSKKLSGESAFSELQRTSLQQAIAEQIHAAILTGRLRPGQRITEQDTSKAMGVSRASIREAFQQLRALGVLSTARRKTFISAEPDAGQIQDIYTFRGLCEGLASEAAKKNLRRSDFERMEGFIEQMELGARRKDLQAFRNADLAFHDLIWQANGKKYLRRILDMVTVPYHSLMLAVLHNATPKQLIELTWLHRENLRDLQSFSGKTLRARVESYYEKVGGHFMRLYQNYRVRNGTPHKLHRASRARR